MGAGPLSGGRGGPRHDALGIFWGHAERGRLLFPLAGVLGVGCGCSLLCGRCGGGGGCSLVGGGCGFGVPAVGNFGGFSCWRGFSGRCWCCLLVGWGRVGVVRGRVGGVFSANPGNFGSVFQRVTEMCANSEKVCLRPRFWSLLQCRALANARFDYQRVTETSTVSHGEIGEWSMRAGVEPAYRFQWRPRCCRLACGPFGSGRPPLYRAVGRESPCSLPHGFWAQQSVTLREKWSFPAAALIAADRVLADWAPWARPWYFWVSGLDEVLSEPMFLDNREEVSGEAAPFFCFGEFGHSVGGLLENWCGTTEN